MDRVWNGTNFKKPRIAQKVLRATKRQERDAKEEKNKREVRRRDKRCRFPLCGCHRFKLALHVAHLAHKGMGGDPDGERSLPPYMIQVCIARHREHHFSLDKKTIKCEPLTNLGTNGPVRWWVRRDDLVDAFGVAAGRGRVSKWLELAVEWRPGQLESLSAWQHQALTLLAEMQS